MKRQLPPNIYRTKGVLYFFRRPGPWIRLETQSPDRQSGNAVNGINGLMFGETLDMP